MIIQDLISYHFSDSAQIVIVFCHSFLISLFNMRSNVIALALASISTRFQTTENRILWLLVIFWLKCRTSFRSCPWFCLYLKLLSASLPFKKFLSCLYSKIQKSSNSLLFHIYSVLLLQFLYFWLSFSLIIFLKLMIIWIQSFRSSVGIVPYKLLWFIELFSFEKILRLFTLLIRKDGW